MTESRTGASALSGGQAPDALPAERSNGDSAGAPQLDELVQALRSGTQADEDGVTVIVSRQACEEAADFIEAVLVNAARAAAHTVEAHIIGRSPAEACRDTESRQPEPHPNTAAETVVPDSGGKPNLTSPTGRSAAE